MKINNFLQKYGYDKVFTRSEIDTYFGYDTGKVLESLKKKGIISQIKRGYYYIHSYGEDDILEHPFFFIKYIGDGKGFISHGAALTYYGILEQFFNSIVVTTTKQMKQSEYNIAGSKYIVTKNRFDKKFGIRKIFVSNNKYYITDVERTILDSFSRPELARGYKEVAKAMYEAIDEGIVDFNILLKYLEYYPNKIKLAKTIGFFIDTFNIKIDTDIYNYLLEISNNSNYVYLDSKTKDLGKGIHNSKWKLILNEFENFKSITQY